MSENPPIKLTLEDMDVTITRTYRLAERVVAGRGKAHEPVQASLFRITKHTWTWGEHDVSYDVYGRVLKANGTPDDRKEAAWYNLPGPPNLSGFPELEGVTLPDPRQPFLDAVDALADSHD